MKRTSVYLYASFLAVLALPAIAHAAAAVVVAAPSIPWGDWITAFLGWSSTFMVTFAAYAVAKFAPAYVRVFISQNSIENAVHYAIAIVDGAVKGKVLDIQTTNQLLDEAVSYLVEQAPDLARRLGDQLKPLILGQLGKLVTLPETGTAAIPGAKIARPR